MVKGKMCPATREAQPFDFLTALCNWRRHLEKTISNREGKINRCKQWYLQYQIKKQKPIDYRNDY